MLNQDHAFAKKKVMITGGTGFIGSNLIRHLRKAEAKVYLLTRSTSDWWRLENMRKELNHQLLDLGDFASLKASIQEIAPHYILHFAQPSHLELQNPMDFQKQLEQTSRHLIHLLEAFRETSQAPEAFVQACSALIYRWSAEGTLFREGHPLEPGNWRGLLKLNDRNICQMYSSQFRLPIRLARIFRAYGPWDQSSKLIIKALDALRLGQTLPLGQAQFKRDYIFVDDLAEGILQLLRPDLPPGIEINFGGPQSYSAPEIIGFMETILGKEIPKQQNAYPPNPYDKGEFKADIQKAVTVLGWKPQTPIRQGLTRTIQWYQDYHQWQP